jgi:M3 family oligoendopeptidase
MTFDFPTWTPAEPDVDALRAAYAGFVERLPTEPAAVLAEEDALVRDVVSWTGAARIRYRQDTASEEHRAARKRADEVGILLSEFQLPLKERLLADPTLAETVTGQEQARWASEVAAFSPDVASDLLAEQELGAEYMAMFGGARVQFEGEELTLSALQKPEVDADRSRREAASRARWGWFDGQRPELDRIFDEMVSLRGSIAKQLGHRDFVETAYYRRSRVDYDRADVSRFRANILEHAVPLVTAIRAQQAEALGIEQLKLWDEPIFDLSGSPQPTDDLEGAGQSVMSALSDELGDFFGLLHSSRLMDLRARPGKGPGGFCSFLAGPRLPFIFANFAGTQAGVKTLVHELGHAFQDYSSRNHPRLADVWPTAEAAEVHSMSLEFLAWPHMEAFFGDDADRFRRQHLLRSLAFLPYGSAIDAFQHAVYEEPGLGIDGRHRTWAELTAQWMPTQDVGDLPHVRDGAFWQRQIHVYVYPFYYIDYVLAQVCALQLWRLSQTDHADAMARWTALCRTGGTLPFQSMVRSVGLRSPFDDGVVEDVVETAASWLGL